MASPVSLVANLPARIRSDAEFGPALLILDHPILRGKAHGHVDLARRSIDWDAIERTCYSSSEQILLDAARAIWDRSADCQLGRVVHTLDRGPLTRTLVAVAIAGGLLTFEEGLARLGVGR